MGNWFSSSRTEFHQRFVGTSIETMARYRSAELNVKPSTLRQAGNGLFAGEAIIEGVAFIKLPDDKFWLSNDPLMNLGVLSGCNGSDDLYRGLHQVYRDYHDSGRAERLINARIIGDPSCKYGQAIKEISKGDEIFRCYGFSTWLSIATNKVGLCLLSLLSFHNFVGYLNFLRDWLGDSENDKDPLREDLTETLTRLARGFGYIVGLSETICDSDSPLPTCEEWDRMCTSVGIPVDFRGKGLQHRLLYSSRVDQTI